MKRCLVVEDDAVVARALIRLLQSLVECDWAANLAEANGYLNTTRYDLWIVDWSLNGTVEALLDRPHPPAIAVTGADSPAVTAALMARGVVAVLVKPPEPTELRAMVRQVLADYSPGT